MSRLMHPNQRRLMNRLTKSCSCDFLVAKPRSTSQARSRFATNPSPSAHSETRGRRDATAAQDRGLRYTREQQIPCRQLSAFLVLCHHLRSGANLLCDLVPHRSCTERASVILGHRYHPGEAPLERTAARPRSAGSVFQESASPARSCAPTNTTFTSCAAFSLAPVEAPRISERFGRDYPARRR